MDQQFDFRALLLKLQDCLSDNDRRRLHFIVGDTIPRHLRDDPTLGGTLSLLESLFDQAKISEQDFDYLIHAFNEIHCYEAVKRLKEHQLAQHRRNQTGIATVNISNLFDDNEEDKIGHNQIFSNAASSNDSEARDSKASQATTISYDQKNINKDILPLTKTSIQSENKGFKINIKFLKQIFKSRLTVCQLILLILNFLGILTFILLIIFFSKLKHSKSVLDILIIKTSFFYGNTGGGYNFNDAQDCSLTFDDKIVSINAGWTSDTLDYVTFSYSNGKSKQHGAQVARDSPYTSGLYLESDESVNGATVYTDTRVIDNPFAPNGSFIVVGLRFYTDKGRSSDLFGSSNGTQTEEVLPGFIIGYVRGRSLGYLDAIQLIWYKKTSPTSTAVLSTY